jgi:hypothetical protein
MTSATGVVTVASFINRETMDRAVLVVAVEDLHAASGTSQTATGQDSTTLKGEGGGVIRDLALKPIAS